MKLSGICITTNNAPRLAAFYQIVLREQPRIEGSHYSFSSVSIWDPGDVKVPDNKHIWLMFGDADIDSLYVRLLLEIPGIKIISPPEKKEWGAYSFWFYDPDGNKISVFEERMRK